MDRVLTNLKMVTMQPEAGYQIIENGMIGIREGKIMFAGHADHEDLHGHPDVIDCHGALVTPGLIDCHTHLIFAGNRANEFEQRLNGVPYEEIAKAGGDILSTVKATREASEDELYEL
ncbi:amidohydrolase family protein, partial [Photobacterium sp. OFAV2-7]|uniref:amidohydrolase family protein n=1 Tax=Photobacterium sp. OFAV2-7 TaxID=2917748 RepID=UPI001EF74B81